MTVPYFANKVLDKAAASMQKDVFRSPDHTGREYYGEIDTKNHPRSIGLSGAAGVGCAGLLGCGICTLCCAVSMYSSCKKLASGATKEMEEAGKKINDSLPTSFHSLQSGEQNAVAERLGFHIAHHMVNGTPYTDIPAPERLNGYSVETSNANVCGSEENKAAFKSRLVTAAGLEPEEGTDINEFLYNLRPEGDNHARLNQAFEGLVVNSINALDMSELLTSECDKVRHAPSPQTTQPRHAAGGGFAIAR